MTITNNQSKTNVFEITTGIYRINTPVQFENGAGFSFNQYLIIDDKCLLFHTGPRKMFPLVKEAVSSLISLDQLSYIGFSHVEADECGSLNEWLAAAVNSSPLCSNVAAMVSVNDIADRAPIGLADGEVVSLGTHSVRWLYTPHMPHAWECGYLFEETTQTLLCGDLFTQGGDNLPALTEADILEPSEMFRKEMDYFSHTKHTRSLLKKLAATKPTTLACMHGSAWRGDGEKLLLSLTNALAE